MILYVLWAFLRKKTHYKLFQMLVNSCWPNVSYVKSVFNTNKMWNSGCDWLIPREDSKTNWHWTHLFPKWPKNILFTPSVGDQVLVHTSFSSSNHEPDKATSARGSAAGTLVEVDTDAPAFRQSWHQSRLCTFVQNKHFSIWCSVF